MKYPKRAVKMLLALTLLAAALLTIWDFSRQTQRALMTETYRTLSEVSKTYSKVFNDRVSATIATMNMMAGHLAAAHDMPKQEIMAILQSAVEEGGFTKMAICGADGVTLSNDGTMVKVSHREYFEKAMAGRADVSDPLTVTANAEESIIISVPIWRQGVVVGALFGGYPLTVAGDHLLDTTYYSQGYGYIISPDGGIILSSDHSDKMVEGKNLLHFFQKTDFTDFSTAALATAMAGGESGSFAYTYHGARRFVSFTPAGINDWYTFSLSSDAPMLRDEKTTTRIVFQLVMKLAVVAALVLAWIVLSNHRHNRQLLRQEEELRLSEKRFSVAINASSGALFELDIRRQLYTHFENAQRIFGVDAETLLEDTRAFSTLPHKEFADAVSRYFFHEDDCPAIQAEMQRLSTGTTASFEARLRRFDNSDLWCRVDLSLIL
ncbi:MAG: cache domain-containing protein, partial [Oscillospiraceae bacterium]